MVPKGRSIKKFIFHQNDYEFDIRLTTIVIIYIIDDYFSDIFSIFLHGNMFNCFNLKIFFGRFTDIAIIFIDTIVIDSTNEYSEEDFQTETIKPISIKKYGKATR